MTVYPDALTGRMEGCHHSGQYPRRAERSGSEMRRGRSGPARCAGIAEDRKGYLFRTAPGHNGSTLLEKPMAQADAWRMIRRRAVAAGIHTPIGNHSFRATGITAYLANGGAL
jgi:integrase